MDSPPLASAGQDVSVLLLLVVLVLLDVLSPWILSLKVSSVRPPGPAGVWALSTPVGFLHFVAFPVPMRMLHDRGDRRLFLGQMGLTLSVQFELALNALFASDPEDNVRLFRFFLYVMYFMVIALFFWPVFLSGSQLHRRVGRVFGLLYAVVLVAYSTTFVYCGFLSQHTDTCTYQTWPMPSRGQPAQTTCRWATTWASTCRRCCAVSSYLVTMGT